MVSISFGKIASDRREPTEWMQGVKSKKEGSNEKLVSRLPLPSPFISLCFPFLYLAR